MSRPAVLEVDPQTWRAEALAYVESRVRAGLTVTADDVRRDLPEPAHPNHVGQAFAILSRRGLIEQVNRSRSTCRARKGGDHRVWVLHHQHQPRRFKVGENIGRVLQGMRSRQIVGVS